MTKRTAQKWLSRMQRAMLAINAGEGRHAYKSAVPPHLKEGSTKEAAVWFRELADALEQK